LGSADAHTERLMRVRTSRLTQDNPLSWHLVPLKERHRRLVPRALAHKRKPARWGSLSGFVWRSRRSAGETAARPYHRIGRLENNLLTRRRPRASPEHWNSSDRYGLSLRGYGCIWFTLIGIKKYFGGSERLFRSGIIYSEDGTESRQSRLRLCGVTPVWP
jgi:hypothetical protein